MNLSDLLKTESADQIILQVKASDLLAFAKELLQQASVPDFMTVNETLDYLKIGRTTLYEWTKKGLLKPIRRGRKCLYRRSDVVTLETFNSKPNIYGY